MRTRRHKHKRWRKCKGKLVLKNASKNTSKTQCLKTLPKTQCDYFFKPFQKYRQKLVLAVREISRTSTNFRSTRFPRHET